MSEENIYFIAKPFRVKGGLAIRIPVEFIETGLVSQDSFYEVILRRVKSGKQGNRA